MHEIIETIVCTPNGTFTPDGEPWPKPRGNINNFFTDDGQQHIGTLYRVRLGPQSWQWQTPEEAGQTGQLPLF
jgi:hypothetical protein